MRGARWWLKRLYVAIVGGPWPRSSEEWESGSVEAAEDVRSAAVKTAIELGAHGLAGKMMQEQGRFFPIAEYVEELNRLQPGAGDKAYERAIRDGRRRKLDRM